MEPISWQPIRLPAVEQCGSFAAHAYTAQIRNHTRRQRLLHALPQHKHSRSTCADRDGTPPLSRAAELEHMSVTWLML